MQALFDTAATAGRMSASKPALLVALSIRVVAGLLLGVPAAAALALTAPATAFAEPSASKAIAIHVEGRNAGEIREEIAGLVPDKVKVIRQDEFSNALRAAGQTKPAGDLLLSKKRRGQIIDRIRAAASKLNADGIIYGIVRTNRQKKKEVYVLYIDQTTGELVVDQPVPMTGSDAERQGALKELLGPQLAQLAPARSSGRDKADTAEDKGDGSGAGGSGESAGDDETSDERDDDEEEEKEEPASDRKPHEIGSALFAVELGVEFGGRWFDYSDGVTANLRPYDVFGAPMISIAGEVYPLAATSIPVLNGLGLTVAYARAFGLDSAEDGGDPIGTTYQRLSAGLHQRFALGDSPATVLGLSGGIRLLEYSFDVEGRLAGEVPEVSYFLLRGGVDARIPVGPVAIAAGFDYLGPLSVGAVYDRFKGERSVGGVGLWGGFMVPVSSGFEVRLLAEYNRFFTSFTPETRTDAYIAGGWLDQYLGIRLAGAYVY